VVNISNTEYHHTQLVVVGGHSVTVTESNFDSWNCTNGIHIDDVDEVYLSGNTVKAWSVGIYLKRIGWAEMNGNHLIARWPIGTEETTGIVANNVSGPVSDGYQFSSASTIAFHHNTFYGGTYAVPGRFGVRANGGSTVDVYNNIITGAQFGVQAKTGSVINADYNLLGVCRFKYTTWWGQGTVNWGENNLFQVDPKLVDPANDDFHIAVDSPAVDAGVSDLGVDIDMDGDLRPMGYGYDIGADEVN
jgi:hypothetical protein